MNNHLTLSCILIVLTIFFGLQICLSNISGIFAQVEQRERYRNINIADSSLRFEIVAKGLKFPTGMAFLGSNDYLITEKNTGNLIRIQNGTKLENPLLTVHISNDSERGLLGIAATDNGSTPRYVFLYFTETDRKNQTKILGNRVYRYELIDNNSRLVNPKLLLDLPFLPGPSHDGGVLKIGPDKKTLYLVIGNLNFIQNPKYMTKAQNVKNGPPPDGRGGILSITFDGNIVGGKGVLGDSEPLNKYYAYGLRNSFGIGFDPVTGNLWDTENGQSMYDEINLVKPGFNSGWGVVQGPSTLKKDFDRSKLETFDGKGAYRDPEFSWLDTVAPTSILFFGSEKLGIDYKNDLFVGSVRNGTVYHFNLNDDRTHLNLDGPLKDRLANTGGELANVIFAKGFGTITDLEVGRDGYLYVLSFPKHDGTLFRIVPK